MCLFAMYIPSLKWLLKLLLVLCGIIEFESSLYVFWIQDLYQINDLPIFSSSLVLFFIL